MQTIESINVNVINCKEEMVIRLFFKFFTTAFIGEYNVNWDSNEDTLSMCVDMPNLFDKLYSKIFILNSINLNYI